METISLEVLTGGERLDVFLSAQLEDLSRSAAQRLADEGRVTIAGVPAKKNRRVTAGEVYTVELPEPEPIEAQPEDIPLSIVYEDGDVVVVNKPRGMVVHPAPGHSGGTLVNALLYHCGGSLSGIGGRVRPGIVHRLDMDTSGLIIAAKNDRAHAALSAQLKDHSLARVYWAVVRGCPREEEGVIDAPIGRHPIDRKRMAVTDKNSREAVTRYRVLERFPGWTLAECRLKTGRTHQIRVHMASLGHPLLGDMVYGAKKPELGLSGQCLHAKELSFIHPTTGETLRLTSPLPDYFEAVLAKLRSL